MSSNDFAPVSPTEANRHGPGAGTTALPTIDCYPLQLAQLCVVPTPEINEHVSHDDCCVVCGSVWPCERAVLAEHDLALF